MNGSKSCDFMVTVCSAGDNDDCCTGHLPPAEGQEDLCSGLCVFHWIPRGSFCYLQCKSHTHNTNYINHVSGKSFGSYFHFQCYFVLLDKIVHNIRYRNYWTSLCTVVLSIVHVVVLCFVVL